MKKFISFSGGVESRTMAILYGNKADAIFSDTGSEHDELYKQLEDVEEKIRAFHGNDFKIVKVKNEQYGTLEEYIRFSKFFPSFHARFCTRMFKIEPIDKYLKQFKEEGVELMIGLNAEEGDKRTGNHGLLKHVKYSYPLCDDNISREMCKTILTAAKILPAFPVYMQRGGCKFCYYKSKREFAAMSLMNKKEFSEVVALEEAIQDKKKAHYSIRDGIDNMKDFGKAQSNTIFTPEEMYPIKNDVTSCGVFCNRWSILKSYYNSNTKTA